MAPRILPVGDDQMDAAQRLLVSPMAARHGLRNIDRTLLNAPAAAQAFLVWGGYILSPRNALPGRQREIVILRTGYLCRPAYEWTHHVPIGRRDGLTAEELARIKAGASAPGWSAADAALIRASDELHADQCITDATWTALREHFSQRQCMDVVFTAGQYTEVAMMLNSFGVQLEPGQTLDPDLR